MSLKYINIAVFVILIITSVVYNSNIETNEAVLSDISKNISIVNDILQNLLKKCSLFKNVSHVKMETTSDKTKLNEFFTGNPDYKFRSKVKIRNPQKFLNETMSSTNESTEEIKNVISMEEKEQQKETRDKDKKYSTDSAVKLRYTKGVVDKKIYFSDYSSESDEDVSANSDEHAFDSRELTTKKKINLKEQNSNNKKITTPNDDQNLLRGNTEEVEDAFDSRELTTQKKINLQEQNSNNKKITTPNDGQDLLRGNTEEVEDPQDVQKVLIIHLGDNTYPDIKTNRATTQNEVNFTSVKNKQQQHTKKAIVFKSRIQTDQNSDSEEETAIQEELIRANTLQVALSDACSKLANRKCIKALKAVLKDVCKRKRKCADAFNLEFSGNAISACDEQFSKIRLINKKKSDHEKYFREYGDSNGGRDSDSSDTENSDAQDQELTGAQFIDYTRQGLDMTCLQALSDVKKPKKHAKRTNNTNIEDKTQNVNKWRDKLEDACRKTYVGKCSKACQSTADKTCENQKCITAKRKAFVKRCGIRCLESYYNKSESESETAESDKGSE